MGPAIHPLALAMNPHCRIGRVRPKAGGDVRLLPSANISCLPGLATRLEIPAERVLLGAISNGVAPVVVVGKAPDGQIYVATSATATDTIALLVRGQAAAISHANSEDEDRPASA
jgi:hypothetical protein